MVVLVQGQHQGQEEEVQVAAPEPGAWSSGPSSGCANSHALLHCLPGPGKIGSGPPSARAALIETLRKENDYQRRFVYQVLKTLI